MENNELQTFQHLHVFATKQRWLSTFLISTTFRDCCSGRCIVVSALYKGTMGSSSKACNKKYSISSILPCWSGRRQVWMLPNVISYQETHVLWLHLSRVNTWAVVKVPRGLWTMGAGLNPFKKYSMPPSWKPTCSRPTGEAYEQQALRVFTEKAPPRTSPCNQRPFGSHLTWSSRRISRWTIFSNNVHCQMNGRSLSVGAEIVQ